MSASIPMARVANPMEGRVERARSSAPPPTRWMVLCRFAYAFLMPAGLLLWTTLPVDGPGRIIVLGAWLLMSMPLGAGANGSWGSVPWSGWHLGVLTESFIIIVAMAWGMLAEDPLVIPFATTLLMGAVLGMGALQLWHALQRRP